MKEKPPEGALTSFDVFMEIIREGKPVYNVWVESIELLRAVKIQRNNAGKIIGWPSNLNIWEPELDHIKKSIHNLPGGWSGIKIDYYFPNYFHAYAFFRKLEKNYEKGLSFFK